MKARVFQLMKMGAAAGLLSGCITMNEALDDQEQLTLSEADQIEEETAPAPPALPSLFFNWNLNNSTMISPPVDIQSAAIEACRKRGYDTSYMIHISIEGDEAISEFGCRGAD